MVEDAEAKVLCPVMFKVATCRFPLPVALVNVMPVEETVVARTVVALIVFVVKFPARVKVPVAETLNWLLELTCRSMKLPLKPEAMLAPR